MPRYLAKIQFTMSTLNYSLTLTNNINKNLDSHQHPVGAWNVALQSTVFTSCARPGLVVLLRKDVRDVVPRMAI